MSNVPHPFEFLLLSLAAWRVYRLLAEDTILEKPRKWVIGEASEKAPQRYRKEVDIFFACPFVSGSGLLPRAGSRGSCGRTRST